MKTIIWDTNKADCCINLIRINQSGDRLALRDNVSSIIANVKTRGDAALFEYTQMFDKASLTRFLASEEDWSTVSTVNESVRQAIKKAYANIRRFHEIQIPRSVELNVDGVYVRKAHRAIDAVGLYVPGGTAPLVSTVLMLAVPAKLAGCKEIVMVTPPAQSGAVNPAVLYAAQVCGIDKIYKIGGAQAIGALAYGTESIPKVDKIFGPGNKYVLEAKLQVSQTANGAAMDMPAGPSEVLIIADDSANPEFVAADLLAQAEHDIDAHCVLVTMSQSLAKNVKRALENQVSTLTRQDIIKRSIASGIIVIAQDIMTCFDISNAYAPEHLILQIEEPNAYTRFVDNAGAVFIGPWSAEALGDYATGSNHVLPTYGYAKSYSGLGVESFMKVITFQEVLPEGLIYLSQCVERMAVLEGLDAHQRSIALRRQCLENFVLPMREGG